MKICLYGQEKTGSFGHRDLKIIRSAEFQTAVDQKLSHLPLVLHFINQDNRLPNLVKHLGKNHGPNQCVGLMTAPEIQNRYGIRIQDHGNLLNFVMVENESLTRHPLTPWIVAHRLKHGYDFIHHTHIGDGIAISRKLEHDYKDRPQLDTNACRTNCLDADIEYFPEAFALWCIKGRIGDGFEQIAFCYSKMIEWGIGKIIVL